jgi:hypothetical protein
MAVTDWDRKGEIQRSGLSKVFKDPKVSVLVEEEFEDHRGGRARRRLIALSGSINADPDEIAERYHKNRKHEIAEKYIVRIFS